LSEAKLKEGVFVGPDIRKLMFDEDILTMTEVEKEAWIVLKSVVTKFLGNHKDHNDVIIFANMLENFKVLIELKNSFFEFTLGFFPRKSWCSE
jgi:hypothetical protein